MKETSIPRSSNVKSDSKSTSGVVSSLVDDCGLVVFDGVVADVGAVVDVVAVVLLVVFEAFSMKTYFYVQFNSIFSIQNLFICLHKIKNLHD